MVCILIGVVQLFANMIDACKFGLYWRPALLAMLVNLICLPTRRPI